MRDANCLYLRKSRADAEAEARGEDVLKRHETALLELAKRLGHPISHIYREIVSGDTIESRPEVQKLLSGVESGMWDGVFVMEIERLARGDTLDQGIVHQTFKYSGTRVYTPAKTYTFSDEMDENYFEFGLFMSRQEFKTIKRRLQTGRVFSAKSGLYCGSRAPYGYERYKLPSERGYSLRIVPEHAQIVRMIFDWYVYGMDGIAVGCGTIARRLNEMGVPGPSGKDWRADALVRILKNNVYTGMIQWGYRVKHINIVDGRRIATRIRNNNPTLVQGRHDSIIPADLFSAAARRMKAQTKAPIAIDRHMYNPLMGLVRCSLCGHPMAIQRNMEKPQYDLIKCRTMGCQTKATYLSVVEQSILDVLRSWVDEYSAIYPQPVKRDMSEQAAEKKLRSMIAQLEKQKSALHDLLEQGIYSVDTFLERQKDIASRIDEANRSLSAVLRPPRISREEAICALLPQITSVLESYASATTPDQKNLLLRSVIDHVVYEKNTRRFKNQPPAANLVLSVYPLLPPS